MRAIPAIALLLVAALLLFGCTGKNAGSSSPPASVPDGDVYHLPTTDLPTAAPAPTSTPEAEFTQQQVAYLLSIVRADAATYGWAAGCLWRQGLEPSDLPPEFTPYDLLRLSNHVASGTYGVAPGGGAEPAIAGTVYQTFYEGPGVTEFELVEGDSFVCYRPAGG